ncbi:MAG: hypothetical protein JSU08_16930 [Acidobacteria bacterium]|nr:hypothetical protein [Acidobacteriota bacterium]
MELSDYCRELEAHLCRKNDGHLIRIAGPSFDVVSRWAEQGVPLKVALRGIDRYFERYYRKGPRRRPVKIDFCEADVLDVFDEWRRATGVSVAASGDASEPPAEPSARRKGPSLPDHLERVLLRLSSLRATGAIGPELDPLIDAVSGELDAARARHGGLRGEERQAAVARLAALDAELMTLAQEATPADTLDAAAREAREELAVFRATMNADAFDRALALSTLRVLRQRLGLPVIAFS